MGFPGKDVSAVGSWLDSVNDVAFRPAVGVRPDLFAVSVQLDKPGVLRSCAVGARLTGDDITAVVRQRHGVGELVAAATEGDAPLRQWLSRGHAKADNAQDQRGQRGQASQQRGQQPGLPHTCGLAANPGYQ